MQILFLRRVTGVFFHTKICYFKQYDVERKRLFYFIYIASPYEIWNLEWVFPYSMTGYKKLF